MLSSSTLVDPLVDYFVAGMQLDETINANYLSTKIQEGLSTKYDLECMAKVDHNHGDLSHVDFACGPYTISVGCEHSEGPHFFFVYHIEGDKMCSANAYTMEELLQTMDATFQEDEEFILNTYTFNDDQMDE